MLMRYTKEQIEQFKQTSMVDILRDLGYNTRHTASGLYFSPFREEKSPSFHINDRDHKWADLGNADPTLVKAGKKAAGGDVVDFVRALKKCSFTEALDYLASFNPSVSVSDRKDEIIGGTYRSPGTIKIEKVSEVLTSRLLTEYGTQKRRIPLGLLQRYCSQVSYRIVHEGEKPSRDYFAIGFPNRSGHWTLRNSIVKLSSGSDITLVSRRGEFLTGSAKPTSVAVAVFEGFFDFLSWLAWRGREVPGDCDAVILNSTSNTHGALDFLLAHTVVVGYFDNDKAGQSHSEWLGAECAVNSSEEREIAYHDCSASFEGYNDINEAWVAHCEALEKGAALEERQESAEEEMEEMEDDEEIILEPRGMKI